MMHYWQVPWKTLANSDIPLVFIIDLFAKKTRQIETCISPKLQFNEFFWCDRKKFENIVKSQHIYLFSGEVTMFDALVFLGGQLGLGLLVLLQLNWYSVMLGNFSWVMEFLTCGYKIVLISSKKNGFQESCCILWIEIAWSLQKLGIILDNKVPPNLKVAKHDFC